MDRAWLRRTVEDVSQVFALDNHYVTGGQGDMLLRELMEMGVHVRATCIGVTDIPACGQPAEVLRLHGLDAESLAQTIALQLSPG